MIKEDILPVTLTQGKVRVPLTTLEKSFIRQRAVELYTPDRSLYILPFEDISNQLDDLPFQTATFDFEKEQTIPPTLDEWEIALLDKFHHTWFNELREFLNTDAFADILEQINDVRDKSELYPSKADLFKPYLTPLDGIQTIVLGTSPLFSTKNLDEKEKGSTFELLRDNGILWLDISLTECLHFTETQKDIWRPFIEKVVEAVPENVSWILTSMDTVYYKCYIKSKTVIELFDVDMKKIHTLKKIL